MDATEMMEKDKTYINLDALLAICYTLDNFEEFYKDLKLLINKANNNYDAIAKDLNKFLNNKLVISAHFKQEKDFFKKYRGCLYIINSVCSLNSFINSVYKNREDDDNQILNLYEHLIKNRADMDKIINVIKRISNLGFDGIYFDEQLDFSNKEYEMPVNFDNVRGIKYFDNLKIIPNYDEKKVKYKTEESSYEIDFYYTIFACLENVNTHYHYQPSISLNNLNFDENKLPKIVDSKKAFDYIIKKKNNQSDNNKVFIDMVNLDLNVQQLYESLDKISTIVVSILNQQLDKMQLTNKEYKKEVISKYPSITNEDLEKEKQKVLRKRY